MAKIIISGSSLTIKSNIGYEDLKLLRKYAPETLSVFDENNVELFRVDATDGVSSVSDYGITFGGASLDGSGKAVLTLDIPSDVDTEAVVDYVEDIAGKAVDYLNVIEEGVPDTLADIENRRAALRGCIEIAG